MRTPRLAREMDAAIDLVKPGVGTDEIALVWPRRRTLARQRDDAFGLQFGHGLGLGLQRAPIISRLNSLREQLSSSRMVSLLRPYCPATDGVSAARIEEEVVVTEQGPAILTHFPAQETHDLQTDLGDQVTSTQAAPDMSYLEHKVAMYRSQVALRRFEQRAYDLFSRTT